MMVKLDSFENIYIDYRILLAIFIIVAFKKKECFSKLKLIKNYLRWTMWQEKLCRLVVLSIKNNLLAILKYKDLINNFVSKRLEK